MAVDGASLRTDDDSDGPDDRDEREEDESEEYGELLKFTLAGFAGGLIAGAILDGLGLQRSGWGQWLVRSLSGEGASILEGIYALRQRLRGAAGSMAEAYGWGKLDGTVFPCIVAAGTRVADWAGYTPEPLSIPAH